MIKIGAEEMQQSNTKVVEGTQNNCSQHVPRDVGLIHSAKLKLAELRDDVESAESDIWTGRGSAERLLCEFRISESSEGYVLTVSTSPRLC